MENMVHLPENLIVSILTLLPVKSLLRFKSVSKSWFSLISDPHFATWHFENDAALAHRFLYLPPPFSYDSQARCVELDSSLNTHSDHAVKNTSFLRPTYSNIKGSCRGFLLFLHHDSYFYLWNPSTSVYTKLSFLIDSTNVYAFKPNSFYGFGYDASRDEYLVVVLTSCDPEDDLTTYHYVEDFETHCGFFSLKTNEWNNIEDTHLPPYINVFGGVGMVLNDSIHWLALRSDVPKNIVLAFNLMKRSFFEVPLPAEDCNIIPGCCDLCVLGGFLSLCVSGYNVIDIWVMKEYKVVSSWSKSIVVYVDELPIKCHYFYPIWSTKNGDIVGINGGKCLVKCNAKGKVIEHYMYCDDLRGCEAAFYKESLFSY
ncbi:PREDICTED: F-box/kelch-repeat protein At3g23880-like [Lupinus angustifolius]|nr:PREDICTED: F-box/kelch-repeat protein At3g23880-like [Lupinus angustifolius]